MILSRRSVAGSARVNQTVCSSHHRSGSLAQGGHHQEKDRKNEEGDMSTTVKLGKTEPSIGVREEVVIVPWYREGLGAQEPILLTFRCIVRSSKKLSRYYIDSVDFVGKDPFSIKRFRFHKKGLDAAIRLALSHTYDVELSQIGKINRMVMWYYNAMDA